MLKNFLAAALRNFARNRFYTGINILGLAIGLAAAILIALFIRHELSYDRFIPGYPRTYLITELMQAGREPLQWTPMSQPVLASLLKTDFPAIESVARLAPSLSGVRQKNDDTVEATERVYWADANIFDVLPLPVIAGDARTALSRPDGVALTRRLARKYFHEDEPIGRTLEIDRQHVMTVTAVLEDLPSNTHLDTEIIASGRASFSPLVVADAQAERNAYAYLYTYARLEPDRAAQPLQDASNAFMHRHFPSWMFSPQLDVALKWVPIAGVHLAPINQPQNLMRPGGDAASISSLSAVALLVLVVAGINFVNLMTARASRRAVEVGVRKSVGGTRAQLILQFIGEAILQALLAMVLAIALVEVLLPTLGAFLGEPLTFDYWRDPALGCSLLALTLLLGILAGAYPAFVLSAFSPAVVLKSGTIASASSGRVREILVIAQFAILIGLIIATGVIYQQMEFARGAGMRVDTDQVLVISTHCQTAFKDEVAQLGGVRAATCASDASLNLNQGHLPFTRRDGSMVLIAGSPIDFGFFELYGIRPSAGRVFSRKFGADSLPENFLAQPAVKDVDSARASNAFVGRVVMNETAVRTLGFESPRAAVDQTIIGLGAHPLQIIGVVPDFAMDAIHQRVAPIAYVLYPPAFRYLNVKLRGRELPETLNAIDALWKRAGDAGPMTRFFLDQHVQDLYLDVTRRARIFAAFAAAAVSIACLGLFALSAFTAERRTKEIGVRKAMGAGNADILRLLVWQFTKPVLWANLLAWPLSVLALRRWLAGFAYHIDLEPWIFALATLLALAIAVVTVSLHSLWVAHANPARALRYD